MIIQSIFLNYLIRFEGICHGSNGAQEVAIKVPKTTWSASCSRTEVENLKAFYVEAQITLGFDHENILSCLGISTGRIKLENN